MLACINPLNINDVEIEFVSYLLVIRWPQVMSLEDASCAMAQLYFQLLPIISLIYIYMYRFLD